MEWLQALNSKSVNYLLTLYSFPFVEPTFITPSQLEFNSWHAQNLSFDSHYSPHFFLSLWRNFVIFRHINWRFFISKMSIRLTLLISFIKISPKFRYEYLNLKNLHWLGLPTGGKFYDIPNWRPKPSPNQKEKPLLWEGSITFSSISENSSYVSWEQSEERTTYSGYVVCVG
jgi:hypothetical protein